MSYDTQTQSPSENISDLQNLGAKFKGTSIFMWIFIVLLLFAISTGNQYTFLIPLMVFYIKYVPLLKEFKQVNQTLGSLEVERTLSKLFMNIFLFFVAVALLKPSPPFGLLLMIIAWIIAIKSWSTLEKWAQNQSVAGGKQNQDYLALQEAFHSIKLAYILCPFIIGVFLLPLGFKKAAKAISGESAPQHQLQQASPSPTIGQYQAAPQTSASTTSSYEPTPHFASPQPTSNPTSNQGYTPQSTPATFGSVASSVQSTSTNQDPQNGRCPFCNAPMKPNATFCGKCGQKTEETVKASPQPKIISNNCPHCGTVQKSGVKFCGTCGQSM